MVEELIAEGRTRDDVIRILVQDFGMNRGDAWLMVDTALGGEGDMVVEKIDGPPEGPADEELPG